jgi:hypothetical protein
LVTGGGRGIGRAVVHSPSAMTVGTGSVVAIELDLAALACTAAFSACNSASSCAEPMCYPAIPPGTVDNPTAVAPDFDFTVRTYGTSPLYGPALVRKSACE